MNNLYIKACTYCDFNDTNNGNYPKNLVDFSNFNERNVDLYISSRRGNINGQAKHWYELSLTVDNSTMAIEIMYCPMCGRLFD